MYTNNTSNRINVPYSVSKKMAYSFAAFILNSSDNITDKVTAINIKPCIDLPNDVQDLVLLSGLEIQSFVTGILIQI